MSGTFPRSVQLFNEVKPPKSEKLPRKLIYTEEDVKKLSPPPSLSYHHSRSRSEPVRAADIFHIPYGNEDTFLEENSVDDLPNL